MNNLVTDLLLHVFQGNDLVRKQKWKEAIQCYSRAIKCFPYDAIFYANRALCYLKTQE
jgi:tetratricopeptide (TPR) repeat protein